MTLISEIYARVIQLLYTGIGPVCVLLALTACNGLNFDRSQKILQPIKARQNYSLPRANGEIFGNGRIRLALILPKNAPDNVARVAQEYRNGALMALQDFSQDMIQLVIKNSAGQAAIAQGMASEAVSEHASAIIGPVFAANVAAVTSISLPANIPVFAFSTDSSTARRGVYLMSYLPKDDVYKTLTHAFSKGGRSILAFLPSGAYGSLIEARLREMAGSKGIAITQFVYYDDKDGAIKTAVESAARSVATSDILYIPDGGEIPSLIIQTIKDLGIDIKRKQILGSGQWESVEETDPNLDGSIYAGRDLTRFFDFSMRYEAIYGEKPNVHASLGYDMVSLSIELVRRNGEQAFSTDVLEEHNGYVGINGIFRFRSDGTVERGLSIYKIEDGKRQVISPAPGSFTLRGF